MAIKEVTTVVCTCDLCGNTCGKNDGFIKVQVHPGDGRDVGPGYAFAEVRVDLPYSSSNGNLCRACTLSALRTHLQEPTRGS